MHRLVVEQFLPMDIKEAWEFFSSPKNLDLITPDDMRFQIISGADEKVYAGQLIAYRIRPLLNIPMKWVTEITHCVDHLYFIDEQRFGPYKFWHHQHHFTQIEDGVLMKDTLHYVLPFGNFGELVASKMIHEKVKNIFRYREKKLNELFKVAERSIVAQSNCSSE